MKLVKLVVVYSLHLDRSIAVVRFILVVVVAVFHSFNFLDALASLDFKLSVKVSE